MKGEMQPNSEEQGGSEEKENAEKASEDESLLTPEEQRLVDAQSEQALLDEIGSLESIVLAVCQQLREGELDLGHRSSEHRDKEYVLSMWMANLLTKAFFLAEMLHDVQPGAGLTQEQLDELMTAYTERLKKENIISADVDWKVLLESDHEGLRKHAQRINEHSLKWHELISKK